jgi:hypothetical protein
MSNQIDEDTMQKLGIVISDTCPGPGYVETTIEKALLRYDIEKYSEQFWEKFASDGAKMLADAKKRLGITDEEYQKFEEEMKEKYPDWNCNE